MKVTNQYHCQLLAQLKKEAGPGLKAEEQKKFKRYMGSPKNGLGLYASQKDRLTKNWIKAHPQLSFKEYLTLLNSLYQKGQLHDEIAVAGRLLEFLPELREQLTPQALDKWLNYTVGWVEVDLTCQSSFTVEEILGNWREWKKLISQFAQDKNIHKRRASLVLLVKAVGSSADPRLAKLAFRNLDLLKKEKEVLITKAISWLLRALIKNHRKEVRQYLDQNQEVLPKIAIRETRRKLLTGRK